MGLNPVGSFVFGRVDGERSVAALAGEVAARFGVSAERALADVGAFIGELVRRGLVEVTTP
ncbi:PqqD family protein [Anaeromyxobacter oryzae]|uniref:PqqD family protein n=1 Tax=Anaeromyxobacter oryzae TaxID=2918170 RepID=UPI0020BD53E6|nr:PqqD family protein [Anaeromyxobacter oryzae]